MDSWLTDRRLPFAMEWINSGLGVRFDAEFREEIEPVMQNPEEFTRYIEATSYFLDKAVNMD
jgi:hypothetical protein